MKKILLATLLGLAVLTSCTKESYVAPVPVEKVAEPEEMIYLVIPVDMSLVEGNWDCVPTTTFSTGTGAGSLVNTPEFSFGIDYTTNTFTLEGTILNYDKDLEVIDDTLIVYGFCTLRVLEVSSTHMVLERSLTPLSDPMITSVIWNCTRQ